jgi:hypothetical protein
LAPSDPEAPLDLDQTPLQHLNPAWLSGRGRPRRGNLEHAVFAQYPAKVVPGILRRSPIAGRVGYGKDAALPTGSCPPELQVLATLGNLRVVNAGFRQLLGRRSEAGVAAHDFTVKILMTSPYPHDFTAK